MANLFHPSQLQTVHNFAAAYNGGKGVTPSYIYRLIRAGKVEAVEIDGVRFIVLPAPAPPGA